MKNEARKRKKLVSHAMNNSRKQDGAYNGVGSTGGSALSRAIAEKLNAAFNLYAWEDSKAEAAQIVADGIRELESQHREMRALLLRIHSARVGMNEAAVIVALNDVDTFFREPNTN